MSSERFDRPDVAATVYGASANHASIHTVINLPSVVEHLHTTLGDATFDACAATGGVVELGEAVSYARRQIQLARLHMTG